MRNEAFSKSADGPESVTLGESNSESGRFAPTARKGMHSMARNNSKHKIVVPFIFTPPQTKPLVRIYTAIPFLHGKRFNYA